VSEYLYLLSNPAMPNLVKVGTTRNEPDERLRQLFSTGVPQPFVLEFCAIVKDGQVAERLTHEGLAEFRLSSNREFFKVGVLEAIQITRLAIGPHGVHTDRHNSVRIANAKIALEHAKQRLDAEARAAKEFAEGIVRNEERKTKLRADIRALNIEILAATERRQLTSQKLESLRNQHKRLGIKPVQSKPSFFWPFSDRVLENERFSELLIPWTKIEEQIPLLSAQLSQDDFLISEMQSRLTLMMSELQSIGKEK